MRACFSVFDCLHIAILTHARTFLLSFWGCKTWCWCEQHGKHGSKAVWDRTLHLASAHPRPLQTSSSTLTHRQMARTSGKRRSWQRLPRQFGTSLSSCQLNLRCWCLKTRPCLIGLAGSGQARKQPPPPHTHTRSRCRLLFSARFEIDCSFIPMDVERGTRLHIAVWSKSVPFCFNIRDASCISWTPPMKPQTPSSAMASPHSQLVFPLFLFPCLAGTVAPISTRAASHFPSTTSPRVCDVFLGVCVCLCLYLCMCLCLSVCDRGRENQVVSATVPRDLGLCLMLLALHVPATLL